MQSYVDIGGRHVKVATIDTCSCDWEEQLSFAILIYVLSDYLMFDFFSCSSVQIQRGDLGLLHISPVTGTNFVVCWYGKFQLGRPAWSPRNKTKMMEHKLVSLCCESEVIFSILSKNFRPGYPGRSVRKRRDLGNWASPASHMSTSNFFIRRKEWWGVIWETEPARLTGLIQRGS